MRHTCLLLPCALGMPCQPVSSSPLPAVAAVGCNRPARLIARQMLHTWFPYVHHPSAKMAAAPEGLSRHARLTRPALLTARVSMLQSGACRQLEPAVTFARPAPTLHTFCSLNEPNSVPHCRGWLVCIGGQASLLSELHEAVQSCPACRPVGQGSTLCRASACRCTVP